MQIITTEIKGPTNSTGSRIRVRSWLESITTHYDHSMGIMENHLAAANQLVNRLNQDRLKDGCERLWSIVAGGEMPTNGFGFVIELNVEVSASWSLNPETGRMEANPQ